MSLILRSRINYELLNSKNSKQKRRRKKVSQLLIQILNISCQMTVITRENKGNKIKFIINAVVGQFVVYTSRIPCSSFTRSFPCICMFRFTCFPSYNFYIIRIESLCAQQHKISWQSRTMANKSVHSTIRQIALLLWGNSLTMFFLTTLSHKNCRF